MKSMIIFLMLQLILNKHTADKYKYTQLNSKKEI